MPTHKIGCVKESKKFGRPKVECNKIASQKVLGKSQFDHGTVLVLFDHEACLSTQFLLGQLSKSEFTRKYRRCIKNTDRYRGIL